MVNQSTQDAMSWLVSARGLRLQLANKSPVEILHGKKLYSAQLRRLVGSERSSHQTHDQQEKERPQLLSSIPHKSVLVVEEELS